MKDLLPRRRHNHHHHHPRQQKLRPLRLIQQVVVIMLLLLLSSPAVFHGGARRTFLASCLALQTPKQSTPRRQLHQRTSFFFHRLEKERPKTTTSTTTRCWLSQSASEEKQTAAAAANEQSTAQQEQKSSSPLQKVLSPKEKRRLKIGLAKAVDRGYDHQVVYQPATVNDAGTAVVFHAKSGLPVDLQNFIVLGIESSCDDTGAAIVHSNGTILGEALQSQHDIHEPWGGVKPDLARDAHMANLETMIELALERAGLTSIQEVDAIGVTVGPGLALCLRVGTERAKQLAIQYNKPFVGVHHLEAHILMARLPQQQPTTTTTHAAPTTPTMEFPFLALLVSGGHCQLLKCLGIGQYEILGGTIDDSLGEAYDKTARLLGLKIGGGGGPAMEQLAKLGNPTAIPFSVPLQNRKHDLDFSYSGLKSNVKRAADKLVFEKQQLQQRATNNSDNVGSSSPSQSLEIHELLSDQEKADIAASFQHVAIQHVEQRLKRAMQRVQAEDDNIHTLAVVGGVAANRELRARLEKLCRELSDNNNHHHQPWNLFIPPPRLCTDQGTMSAWAAIERLKVGSSDDPHTQDVHARFPFASLQHRQPTKETEQAEATTVSLSS